MYLYSKEIVFLFTGEGPDAVVVYIRLLEQLKIHSSYILLPPFPTNRSNVP